VPTPALIPDRLIHTLRALCAQPSASGQQHELAASADVVQQLMQRCGLDALVAATPGAPVVIGTRAGRSPDTLLLYHHYDTAPTGPWRHWNHEPHMLAERDGALFARGVAAGKGPLAAHLCAIAALVDAHEATRLIETLLTRALKTAADTQDSGQALKSAGKIRRTSQRQDSQDRSQNRGAALQQWLKTVQAAPEHRELVSLAVTLHEVASRGEAERTMCREMLESLARWTERRHTTDSGTEYLF